MIDEILFVFDVQFIHPLCYMYTYINCCACHLYMYYNNVVVVVLAGQGLYVVVVAL